ncbi:hypothetical protein ABES23_06120 [Peribacillus frigoritolerans]|uniref:hypothetical protein n=1 Tax=Peribacillus frigoritolerans TaxID=450367 RepID=UPI003D2D6A55
MKNLFEVFYKDGESILVAVDSTSFGVVESKAKEIRKEEITEIRVFGNGKKAYFPS